MAYNIVSIQKTAEDVFHVITDQTETHDWQPWEDWCSFTKDGRLESSEKVKMIRLRLMSFKVGPTTRAKLDAMAVGEVFYPEKPTPLFNIHSRTGVEATAKTLEEAIAKADELLRRYVIKQDGKVVFEKK